MTPPSSGRFLEAVRRTQAALDGVAARSMLIGGVAVIAHGVPRTTLDVDATIDGESADLEALLAAWAPLGISPRVDDPVAFARRAQVLLLRHDALEVDFDLTLAWLPFEAEALARSELVDLGPVRVRVPSVNDLLVYKLVASRPRDLDDAERLLLANAARVSPAHVRAAVADFAAALDDTERPRALERLFAKTRVGTRP